jgi:hypothetical protein
MDFIFIFVNDNECNFEAYDDNKLSHALAGPDYGQCGETDLAWSCIQSKEYNQLCFSALSSSILLIQVLNILKTK